MKKLIVILLVILAIVSCKKEKVINLGFIGPLTGDYANYGIMMSNAARIAVEEKNANGGIGGVKVNLIAEDSEGKGDKAMTALEKLIKINNIYGLVGGVFSGESLTIAPKAEASKLLMCTPSGTHKDITSKGEYIFRNVLSDQLQAVIFAKYVKNVLKINNIAILYFKNDYSQGLANDFKDVFEKEGGKVVAFESGKEGDKDFKTQLTTIKSANPEALYIPGYIAEMAQILEQQAQLGLKVKILSADGFSNPEIFDLAKDYALDVLFSNSPEDNFSSEAKTNFVKKYKEKYGVEPDAFSLNSYDIAVLMLNSIEQAYNQASDADKNALRLDRKLIRDTFANTMNYQGVSGNITFLPNGDVSKNVGIYKTVKEGGKYSYKQIAMYRLTTDNNLEEIK